MVRDDVVEFLTLLLLGPVHELAYLILQALAVSLKLLVVHTVPTVRRVRADGLADRDVMVQLEDPVRVVILRVRLFLARVDGIALDTVHGVEGLVHGGVENAAARGKLPLPLPVVGPNVEHEGPGSIFGTFHWQRQGEFAPGSGILHASMHQTFNSMDGVKCYSIYPSKKQTDPQDDDTYRIFKLDHDIPICESVSPNSSYRWHSMDDQ